MPLPAATKMFVLSQHKSNSYVLMVALALSFIGIRLENKSIVGKSLSAPIITMAFSLVLSNLFVLPFESAVYSKVGGGESVLTS